MQSLWIYRRNRKPRHVSIKKVGGEPDFYRHETGDFEQELARRESGWAQLLEKLLKDGRLYGNERLEFSRFVGLMSTRGRYFFDMVQATMEGVEEYITLRTHTGDEAEKLRQRLTPIRPCAAVLNKQWTLTEMLETGGDLARLYDQMKWVVVIAQNEDDYAVTCDAPVSLTDPRGPLFTKTGVRYSSDAEFTLPLDRRHILWGTGKRNEGALTECGYAFRQLNRRTVRRAYKAVYASLNSPGLAALVNNQLHADRPLVDKEKLVANINEGLNLDSGEESEGKR